MEIHLLATPSLFATIPPEIKVLNDWGLVTIIADKKTKNRKRIFITGQHIHVSGEKADFIKWLGPVKGFWLGIGSPMLQRFEIHHIKNLPEK